MIIMAKNRGRWEGTGTWPDYLVDRAEKKMEGQLGEKIAHKSRNICRVMVGVVGA